MVRSGVLWAWWLLLVGGLAWGQVPFSELELLFTSAASLPGEVRGLKAECRLCGITAVDEWTLYTSAQGRIQSFCFHPQDTKLFFVRPGSGEIRVVQLTPVGPLAEWVLYEHPRPVYDLAFGEGPDGEASLYFSELDGEGWGRILRLEGDGDVSVALSVWGGPGFHWGGFFSFGPDGAVYLSSGGRLPGRLYRWSSRGPEELFRIEGDRIGGFVFLDLNTILYANLDGEIHLLELAGGRQTPIYRSRGRFRISDVGLLPTWWPLVAHEGR
ncbi:hypothetical protein H5T52_08620 [Candidatus Bipolaricaulota bacterium]|nr:hypothetical protein [Candidatus Bipolaricaulota bacterium]